ncbi:ABC transporter permease [bacterium]|nr:ABC transporter permease [bacterium]
MRDYIIRRLLLMVPVIVGVATLVFLFIHLIPGDPVVMMLGDTAQPADFEALRHELGLDKPLFTQYLDFWKGLFTLDLGRSFVTKERVLQRIFDRYWATCQLAIISLVISIMIALPAGIISSAKPDSIFDRLSMLVAMLGISVPSFWLGPMLIYFFSVKLDLLPVSGSGTFLHLILPGITLGTGMAAITARMTRASMLDVIKMDYIITARAKGLSEFKVFFKHALRNALIPVVTILGLQTGALLSGAIITETIFSWPGIGYLTIEAIKYRDYPQVQACILVISSSYVIINLLTDLLYSVINPRIELR